MNAKNNGIEQLFEYKSVSRTIGLCIVTFGFYVIYRLYKYSVKIRTINHNWISNTFMYLVVVVHCVSFGSLVMHFSNIGPEHILIFSKFMHLFSSVFHVVWLLRVRNEINKLNGLKKGDSNWLNPILSSFLHVIYMQYKINQVLNGIAYSQGQKYNTP
jgi:hypothetical protein